MEAVVFTLNLQDYKDHELWHFSRERKSGKIKYGNTVREKADKVKPIHSYVLDA